MSRAKHHRERAEECLLIAELMKVGECKRMWYNLAAINIRAAEMLEDVDRSRVLIAAIENKAAAP